MTCYQTFSVADVQTTCTPFHVCMNLSNTEADVRLDEVARLINVIDLFSKKIKCLKCSKRLNCIISHARVACKANPRLALKLVFDTAASPAAKISREPVIFSPVYNEVL